MKKNIHYEDKPIDLKSLPQVSLIIPFSPEMRKPKEFSKKLASAADKAAQELMIKYSKEQAVPVIKKLRDLIQHVKFSTNEKTLAIFVSPIAKKIYYFTPSKSQMNYVPPVLVQKTN